MQETFPAIILWTRSEYREMSNWPPLTYEPQMWVRRIAGSAPAASLGSGFNGRYESAVPPRIADTVIDISSDTLELIEAATEVLIRFDGELGSEIAPFAFLLLRSEAVASSRIENLTASARSILSAELGVTGKPNATLIAANTQDMHQLESFRACRTHLDTTLRSQSGRTAGEGCNESASA